MSHPACMTPLQPLDLFWTWLETSGGARNVNCADRRGWLGATARTPGHPSARLKNWR